MPPRTRKALSKIVDLSVAAYAALSTPDRPITPALVRAEPSITRQLESLSTALMREVKVPREILDAHGKRITVLDTILPFGIGPDLRLSWPHLLKLSDLPDARAISQLYERLEPAQARSLPVEAFCIAAGLSPMRVIEILTGILVRQGATASTILAAVWHPRVVEKTVQMALQDDGVSDRATLHKATGFTPSPKGSQTIINVQNSANAANIPAVFVPAPSPESTVRLLADTFNEARGLPALVTQPTIDIAVDDAPDNEDE
jgi:hypothetical protein